MSLIWATRGRTWGFRFLSDAGLADPLAPYERAFKGLTSPHACHRLDDCVALRFPDPEGRCDASGRIIPHDFLLYPPLATGIESVEEGRRRIWPLVSQRYARLWVSDTA